MSTRAHCTVPRCRGLAAVDRPDGLCVWHQLGEGAPPNVYAHPLFRAITDAVAHGVRWVLHRLQAGTFVVL